MNGIVTLTGTVDNVMARDRAADLAEMVKGVFPAVVSLSDEVVSQTTVREEEA